MRAFALILTADPRQPAVSRDVLAQVENHLATAGLAAEPTVLRPDSAVEYAFSLTDDSTTAALRDRIRTALSPTPVDVNIVPAGPDRRKAVLIADMDSTIIQQECIDEIARRANVGVRVANITERAMRGELDFEAALTERVGLLAGLPASLLQDVFNTQIEMTPGARTLVATMRAHGAHCALVSGGFTFFTSLVAELAGFHENRANTLEISDGKLTGRVVPPILGQAAKLEALETFIRGYAGTSARCLAVGDGANDLAMIRRAGLGVAFRAKPVVAREADASIEHGDLTALLHLQGYTEAMFVGA